MRSENEISGSTTEERGIPGTSARKKSKARLFVIVLIVILLMCVGVAFGIMTINRFTSTKLAEKAAARKVEADKRQSASESNDLSGIQAQIKHDEAASDAAASAAAASSGLATPAGAMASSSVATSTAQPGTTGARADAGRDGNDQPAMSNRDAHLYNDDLSLLPASGTKVAGLSSGVSDGVQETMNALQSAVRGNGNSSLLPAADTGKSNAFQDSLQPSSIANGTASFLPDLDYLLKRGTIIRCGTITRVNTTLPGPVKCMVLEDVYSANGHTLLIRRGATAFGEQRQALLQGQARIAVLWDEIDDGPVQIIVNSPATDSLGATGLEAYVDNHFWERFGGATMVTLIGDFGQALSNRTVGGGSGQITIGGSGNDATSVAEEVLRNTINIPPTAYTNQGQITNIFVARHVDMRSVYQVVKR